MLAAAIGVVSYYTVHEFNLLRYGDNFGAGKVTVIETPAWVVWSLIVIASISVIGVLIFIRLYFFRGKESANV